MLKSVLIILSLGLSVVASEQEVQSDTHPKLCQEMRLKAYQNCGGKKSCYTAELSRLVDFYNSELRWNDQQEDLHCNY